MAQKRLESGKFLRCAIVFGSSALVFAFKTTVCWRASVCVFLVASCATVHLVKMQAGARCGMSVVSEVKDFRQLSVATAPTPENKTIRGGPPGSRPHDYYQPTQEAPIGLRCGEIMRLTLGEIQEGRACFIAHTVFSKIHKSRLVPVPLRLPLNG